MQTISATTPASVPNIIAKKVEAFSQLPTWFGSSGRSFQGPAEDLATSTFLCYNGGAEA